MKLRHLRELYSEGMIEKHQYINEIHLIHKLLYDYAEILKETDIKKIEITEGQVTITTRSDINLIGNPTDMRIAPHEILNFNNYEYPDEDMVFNLITDGMTIFDIGANIGWYTLNLGKRYPNAKIYAFEPIPQTFSNLQKHVLLNGITNATLFQFGFSDKEYIALFYYYPGGSGNASLENLSGNNRVETIPVQVWKLNRFIHENNTHPDFIKCDVEGAELLVFKGGLKSIKRDRPIIFTELLRIWCSKFRYHPNDVIVLLKDIGYRCFSAKEKDVLIEHFTILDTTTEKTFFFLHEEKHQKLIEKHLEINK